jgi:predicted nucleic acid-binding Zn ribbon protein
MSVPVSEREDHILAAALLQVLTQPQIAGLRALLTAGPGRGCVLCGAELPVANAARASYCSTSCRAVGSRLRHDPAATIAHLLTRAQQRCQGCGCSLAQRRTGAKWCSDRCRRARGRVLHGEAVFAEGRGWISGPHREDLT